MIADPKAMAIIIMLVIPNSSLPKGPSGAKHVIYTLRTKNEKPHLSNKSRIRILKDFALLFREGKLSLFLRYYKLKQNRTNLVGI
jgi:hypothetical protein